MSGTPLEPAKLITCILPHGRGLGLVRFLKESLGICGANVSHARGAGRLTHSLGLEHTTETEKDILTVIVPEAREAELFERIHERAGIGEPHGGLMYVTALSAASIYCLPDLPDEA